MTQKIMAVISPDMVPARHYFLQELAGVEIIWIIRAVCILAALAALIVYAVCRRRREDKEV